MNLFQRIASKKSPSSASSKSHSSPSSKSHMRSTRKLLKGSVSSIVNPATRKLVELNIEFEELRDLYTEKVKSLGSKISISKKEQSDLDRLFKKLETKKDEIVTYLDISIRSSELKGGKSKRTTQKNRKI